MAGPQDQAQRSQEFDQTLQEAGLTPEPAAPSAPAPPAPAAPSATPTGDDQKILEFKSFLTQLGLYHGNTSDPTTDPAFITAAQALEEKIQTALEKASSKPVPPMKGMIWQGNHINPQTSVADVIQALKLIQQAQQRVKSGQATVDTFDTEEYQTQQPIAFKPNPNREDYNIETGDPDETQQIGEFQEKIPAEMPEDAPDTTMDDRVLELNKLMNQLTG
jgi:hypothetical protein